LRYE